MVFLCFSLARTKQTARRQVPPANTSEQRKRHVEDDRKEESDEECTPDESGRGGSCESGSENEGPRERSFLFI